MKKTFKKLEKMVGTAKKKKKEFLAVLTIHYDPQTEKTTLVRTHTRLPTISTHYPPPLQGGGSEVVNKKSSGLGKYPSLPEVESYINENHLNVDPEFFYNYFTEAEWVDAKGKKVKNWKLKCRTWHNVGHAQKKREESVSTSATYYSLCAAYESVTGREPNSAAKQVLAVTAKKIDKFWKDLPGSPKRADIDKPFIHGKVNKKCRHSVKYFYKKKEKFLEKYCEFLEGKYGDYPKMKSRHMAFDSETWLDFVTQEEEAFGLDFETGKRKR